MPQKGVCRDDITVLCGLGAAVLYQETLDNPSFGMQVLCQHRDVPEGCGTEAHAPQPADS